MDTKTFKVGQKVTLKERFGRDEDGKPFSGVIEEVFESYVDVRFADGELVPYSFDAFA